MDELQVLKVGEKVPDMEMEVYFPQKKDFGKIKFSDVTKKGKWIVLFFYPADYTFVCPTELADMGVKYETDDNTSGDKRTGHHCQRDIRRWPYGR